MADMPMPGMSGISSNQLKGYAVKYYKANLDDLENVMMLQDIETKGLEGKSIVVLSKDKFVFMESYYIIIQYMEKVSS